MDYAIVYSENYLAHHGILGQKWGVRRFQNTDGSYTAAGKERYGRGESRKNPELTPRGESRKQKDLTKDSKYASAKEVSIRKGAVDKLNRTHVAVSNLNRSTSHIERLANKYKAKRMSDEELDKEIEKLMAKQEATRPRREKENQYQQLKNQEINTGREVLTDALSVVGNVVTGVTAAASLYLVLRDIRNS